MADDAFKGNSSVIPLNELSSSVLQARNFGLGFPIVYFIGWLAVAYFSVYFIVVHVGPVVFGTRRPMSGPFFWGPPYRRGGLGLRKKRAVGMDQADFMDVMVRVARAISENSY